ncbi:MAG: rhodanese-like domain-containing protein [Proteobacteria bacterium]|nr:rhodanese-like domain-containing protein [Pseudomonadota bacterium]
MHGSVINEIMPKAAWEMLQNEHDAYLIDVRTQEEWQFVGIPDLSSLNRETVFLSWRLYPTMRINDDFAILLEERLPDHHAHLLFICKSGARSTEAAIMMLQHGYKSCYNVTGGFEGDMDKNSHRGIINGWKAAGLPWRQS